MTESWGFCLGRSVLVDNRTEPSQNGRIRGVLLRETCFGGQPHKTLPEWPNQGGFCLGKPVLVDNRTEPSQNGRIREVLLREICLGGQPHRTLPEWPNQRGSA